MKWIKMLVKMCGVVPFSPYSHSFFWTTKSIRQAVRNIMPRIIVFKYRVLNSLVKDLVCLCVCVCLFCVKIWSERKMYLRYQRRYVYIHTHTSCSFPCRLPTSYTAEMIACFTTGSCIWITKLDCQSRRKIRFYWKILLFS